MTINSREVLNTMLRQTRLARNILLFTIFAVLLWGFAVSPEFKDIAAGVAIFLFGMMALEDGFRAFSGGVLEKFLKASTGSLGRSLAFGALSTTLMQSSSLVSVLTISFLSSGLITLAAGIGIIFGSNIGTTTGAWLVAGVGLKVDIAAFALPMIVLGVVLVFQNAKALKGAGYVLAGVGFLFLGIDYMKIGFSTFQESFDLSQFAMTGFIGVLVYALIGACATVVMQSSHATLILSITALAAGQITYENSLAIAIGANIGTTATAIIGSLSADVNGKRLALAHLFFNLTTGAIAIVFINQLAAFVENISGLMGIAEDDYTLKFATFHTVFNVIGVAVMIPLIGKLTEVLMRLVKEPKRKVSEPYFLNETALEFPDTAVKILAAESVHVFSNCVRVICNGLGLDLTEIRSAKDPAQIVADYGPPRNVDIDQLYANKIKELHNAFLAFASRAAETEYRR
jgi:phosphate:Na+ symporter